MKNCAYETQKDKVRIENIVSTLMNQNVHQESVYV